MKFHCLACDLGAESGRVMLGSLAGEALSLEEIHRFPNAPLQAVVAERGLDHRDGWVARRAL